MHIQRRTLSVHVCTFLTALASAAMAPNVLAHDEPIEGSVATGTQTLTNRIVAAIAEYQASDAGQRPAVAGKLKAAAMQRRAILLAAMERNPGFAMRQFLPNGLTAALPADVRNLLEQEVKLTGHVGFAIGDDMRGQAAKRRYVLEVSEGPHRGRYALHAADLPDHPGHVHPAAAFVGKAVTVRAFKLDGQLMLGSEGSIEAAAATVEAEPMAGSISGTHTTLVLLGNFRDKFLDSSCTPSFVNAQVFGASNSVSDVFRQSSNGAVSFSGGTYGPYQLQSSSSTTDLWAVGDEMDRLAAAQGINPRNYSKTVYVVPSFAVGYAGASLISVSSAGSFYRSWIMQCGATDLYAHEIGHLVGFAHASSGGGEYGDTSDIMGLSGLALRQFSAPRKVNAGWIPQSRVINVTGPGTYTLDATAATSPANPQTLVLPKPDTGDSYYISLRQPIGYDAGLNASYVNKVSVHRATSTVGSSTNLLTTLAAGQSFSDSGNGYRVTVNSIGTSASVTVDMPGATCSPSNPGIALSPATQSGSPGRSLTYQVTVTNRHSSGCGTTTFNLGSQVPAGWGATYSPSSVSLGSGASTTVTWTVTSPTTGVVAQSYALSSTTQDAASSSYTASAQGNYIVTMPDSNLPSVSFVSPANGATVSGNTTVTVNAADNVGIAKVELWNAGRLVGTDTAAPYSFTWNTRKLSGSQTLTARAYDAAGNPAQTSITVTVIGSGPGNKNR